MTTRTILSAAPFALAAVLATGVIALIFDRASFVQLDRAEWRCTAGHDAVQTLPRATGGVEFRVGYACDQWSRR